MMDCDGLERMRVFAFKNPGEWVFLCTQKPWRLNMKKVIILLMAIAVAMGAFALQAGDEVEKIVEKKIVVAMNTDDFELDEIDISDLAVGDAETIVTESGKTIDLLRTEDGVEIYVDGEMMDIPHMGAHGGHKVVNATVEVICDDEDEECEKVVWMSEDGEIDEEALHEFLGVHGADVDIDIVHGGHHDGAHKVIVIESESEIADVEGLHEAHEGKVIVIRKQVEETL